MGGRAHGLLEIPPMAGHISARQACEIAFLDRRDACQFRLTNLAESNGFKGDIKPDAMESISIVIGKLSTASSPRLVIL